MDDTIAATTPREATHAELLLTWWKRMPLNWAFVLVIFAEIGTFPLSIFLHSLEVLPPLFTLYPGSDWLYGSSGYIIVNSKKEPVNWRWLYLVHHPVAFCLSTWSLDRLRASFGQRIHDAVVPVLNRFMAPTAVQALFQMWPSLLGLWLLPHVFGCWVRAHVLKWRVMTHPPYMQEGQGRALKALKRTALVYSAAGVLGMLCLVLLAKSGLVTVVVKTNLWEQVLNYESVYMGAREEAPRLNTTRFKDEEYPDFEL